MDCTKAFEEMHLSVLEATYQVVVLRPYFANVGKRLVKTPKCDLGINRIDEA